MVNDAKSHAAEDKKKRESVDIRNQADQLVYQTEKNITEMDEKLTADDKSKLEAAVGRVKEAVKGENVDEITSSTEALSQVWSEMASKMYQAGEAPTDGAEAQTTADQAGDAKDENVEEADFEVVDDDKSSKK